MEPMGSLVLRTTARLLQPLLLLFSIFLLLTGHNQPGGGFIGALTAAAAFALLVFSHGPLRARASLGIEPRTLCALGLLTALASGSWQLLVGQPLLTPAWTTLTLPSLGPLKVGTPLLFDLGVYLLVLGVTLWIVFALAEQD